MPARHPSGGFYLILNRLTVKAVLPMKTVVALLSFAISSSLFAQVSNDDFEAISPSTPKNSKLRGFWTFNDQGKAKCYKHFMNGRFYYNRIDPITGNVTYSAFGFYSEKENGLTEKIRFISENDIGRAGKSYGYLLGFAGTDVYSQENTAYKEVWSRVLTKDDTKTLEAVADYSDAPTAYDGIWVRVWLDGSKRKKGLLKVYDRGRVCMYWLDLAEKKITGCGIGIFSVDEKTLILREHIQNTFADGLHGKGLWLSKLKMLKGGVQLAQTQAGGGYDIWTRW